MKKTKIFALVFAISLFSAAGFSGCSKDDSSNDERSPQAVTVYMPDGAPAMAFAKLMKEDTAENNVSYTVVDPSTIAARITNKDESKNADICVLPVTAASKLVGDGTRYQMLGVVTNGNLCILSKDEALINAFETNACQDISYLVGKTVGVMKINDLPGVTFKSILDGYGLDWQELKNDGEVASDKVNLKAIADATAIDAAATDVACYVVAEPAASVQVKKKGFTNVCALEVLYDQSIGKTNADAFEGYPQAVMVAKTTLLQSDAEWVNSFIGQVEASIKSLNNGELTGEEIVNVIRTNQEDEHYKTTLSASVLTADVIVRCAVRFTDSATAKTPVQQYLAGLIKVEATAAKAVGDGFFYVK